MQSITLADVYREAHELGTGTNTPSVKLALWIGILSADTSVVAECRTIDKLRAYVAGGLPTSHEELYQAIKGHQRLTFARIDGLYYVESLERSGQLDGLQDIGTGWDAQNTWRDRVYSLTHGHGLGYKTISMAALVLSPLTCELVPVDRHVLARFGIAGSSPQTRRRYLSIEQLVRDERDAAGNARIPLALWHWYKWEEWRVASGTNRDGICVSHSGLSCRTW